MRSRLACVIVMIVGACGGGASAPDAGGVDADTVDAMPDAPLPVTRDELCGPDGALSQLVQHIIACNPTFDLLLAQGQATPANLSAFCNGAIGDYLDDGTVALPTRAALDACLAYIANTSCLDLDFDGPPCDLFVGTVADSAGCENVQQCGAASFCARPDPNSCGTCVPRAGDGQPCTINDECTNNNCIGNQCGPISGTGAPCVREPGDENQDCLGQRACDTTGHCQPPRTWQLNDACTTSGDCGIPSTDLYCKGNGTGAQCARYLMLGDPCTPNNAPSGLCDLRQYEWCNAAAAGGAKCSAANLVAVGHPCNLLTGDRCAPGLVCSDPINSGGKCYAPGAKGDPCGGSSDAPCGLFLGCLAGHCAYNAYSGQCP